MQAVTSAVLSGLGNAVAQAVVEGRGLRGLEAGRLWRFTVLGLLLSPVSHYKFLWLESLFRFAPQRSGLYGKLALDQLAFGPLFNVLFYVLLAILNGQPSSAAALVRANFWPTTINSWKVWPIASFVSFNYVPEELRVLFANIVGFFWVIVLSVIAARRT